MTDKESDTGKFYTNYRFEYPKENVVVATSSFQEVPSNEKPLINLTMNGILRPSEEKIYEIKMIFDGNLPQKDRLAQSYGTFVLCKGVYNARKIVRTAWEKEKSTLTVFIDLRREKVRPRRPAQFSLNVQIDDSSYPSCKNIPNITTKNISFGKTVTFRVPTVNGTCTTGVKAFSRTVTDNGRFYIKKFCSGKCTSCRNEGGICLPGRTTCCKDCRITTDGVFRCT